YIVSVNGDAGHPISLSSNRDVLHRHLFFYWSGVSILIIVADKDDRYLQNRSQIQPLMPIPSTGGAVSKVTKDHLLLFADFECKSDSSRHRDRIGQHTDKGHDVLAHVTHVHVG